MDTPHSSSPAGADDRTRPPAADDGLPARAARTRSRRCRVAVAGDSLVLVPEAGGDPIKVMWSTGWTAWRLGGRAELVSRDGTVVGREGEVLSGFGGGTGTDDAFRVCEIGG